MGQIAGVPKLKVAKDGSKAIIEKIYPELQPGRPISLDDIKKLLKTHGIVHGIKWKQVEKTLEFLHSHKKPLQNIVIAEQELPPFSISFPSESHRYENEEIKKLKQELKRMYKYLSEEKEVLVENSGIFVKENNIAFEIHLSGVATNIFGREQKDYEQYLIKHTSNLSINKARSRIVLMANISGYLVVDKHGRFDIFSPLKISSDKMRMYCLIFPVKHGEDLLIKTLYDSLGKIKDPALKKSLNLEEEIDKIFKDKKLSKLILAEGIPPVSGKDAQLIFHIEPKDRPFSSTVNQIDYKELTPYQEVEKDTIIAEKICAKEGIPGKDVFGEIIPVYKGKDIPFKTGPNVREEKEGEKIIYRAEITGILTLTQNFAAVSEELHIRGDVDTSTGNLKYKRDIKIDGNVNSNFKVICGGDLTIKKNIDNGAFIVCKGNLTVDGGIFGEKTFIEVEGDANVSFIQEATLKVKGKLMVKNYVYNAYVFSGDILKVEGKMLRSTERGSVVGGRLNSMKSMYLHSAGSKSTKTFLICGVNKEVEEKIKDINTLVKILVKKISKLQDRAGIELTDKSAFFKIKNFPPERKRQIKEILLELKELVLQREKMLELLPQLEKKAISEEIENLSIEIYNHIIPDLIIRIGKLKKVVREFQRGVRYFLKIKDREKFGRLMEIWEEKI